MKVLFLVTRTENCEPFWRSLEAIGHEVVVERYDDRPHDRHGELVELASRVRPGLIAYIGAYEPSHGAPVPQPDIFCRLREVAPSVMLCGDAADDPWWPVLENYHSRNCFTIYVAIDGSPNCPIARWSDGLVLLTPVDVRSFRPRKWNARNTRLGMIGGLGHRRDMIHALSQHRLLSFNNGPVGRSYEDFATLMCRTKVAFNISDTGTGKYLHVKGRVVEAGMAGCCLLEPRGSPTALWFKPYEEFREYDSIDHIAWIMENTTDDEFEVVAKKFHCRMVLEHHPKIFWGKVLAKMEIAA